MSASVKRWAKIAAGLGALAAGGFAVATLWQTSQALERGRDEVERAGRIDYEVLRPAAPAGSFEEIPAKPRFVDAVRFGGDVWMGGPGGVYRFNAAGDLLQIYRTGFEAPPAATVRLRTGLDPRTSRPGLFAALAGEGLLIFSEDGSYEQVRALDAAARDLTDLLPLASGRVLLGTQQSGVLAWDGTTLSPLHAELTDLHVTALAGDESELWIGTLDAGALRWSAGALTTLAEAEGLPDRRVLSFAVTGEATYIGTPVGVAEVTDGRVTRTLADGFFARALAVRDAKLWIGTLDEGLAEIPLDAGRRVAARAGLRETPERVERFADLDGELYALAPNGLFPLTAGGRALTPEIGALTDRNISALRLAAQGQLWVGYFDRGLDVLGASGRLLTHLEDETLFCINRIAPSAHADEMLVATANGLVSLDGAARPKQVLRRSDGLIADHVTDISIGPDGVRLATPAGLTFLGPGGARSLYAFHGLVNNHVYSLGARGSTLLAGTLGGLTRLENGVVRESFTTANSPLGHNWISGIAWFRDAWFIATYGAGVLRLDEGGRWRSWPEMKGVEINPNALIATERGVVAGTLDRGLLVYDPEADRWRTVKQGLPSLNVTALEAAAGWIYAGTENGLVRAAEENLAVQ